MAVEYKSTEEGSNSYPKLMIVPSTGTIFLMTSKTAGMVVSYTAEVVKEAEQKPQIGGYNATWDPIHMRDYNGVVTLENANKV